MVRELLAVAARAALQWALATALLANGAAFCLIAACSERLRLGAPCVLCARVHRLLCSSSAGGVGGDGRDALRLLLCDAHLAAATGPEEQPARGGHGGSKESEGGQDVGDRDKVSGTHRVVSIGSEICERERDTGGSDDAGRAGGTGVDNGQLVSLFELAPIAAHPRDDGEQSPHKATAEHLGCVDGGGERLTVGQLLSLRAQRRELDALRAELDEERRARAAAEELQRQLEEQSELDREAARLAMELVHETEREKRALQQQLDACRARAQLWGGGGGHLAGNGKEGDGAGDGGDNNNNYQSLVDFLPPGSVYSSSPDLASLLTHYDEPASGINGDRRRREGYVPAVAVVAEDVEEEEEEVAVSVTARTECSAHVDGSAAITDDSPCDKTASCPQVETTVTGAT